MAVHRSLRRRWKAGHYVLHRDCEVRRHLACYGGRGTCRMNLAILDEPRWQTQMDPLADAAAADIISRGGVPAMSLALELLSAVPPEKPWPAGLKEYVQQTSVPTGVDWTRVRAAQDWFNTWGVLATAS